MLCFSNRYARRRCSVSGHDASSSPPLSREPLRHAPVYCIASSSLPVHSLSHDLICRFSPPAHSSPPPAFSLSFFRNPPAVGLFLDAMDAREPISRTFTITAHGTTTLTVVYTNEEWKLVETLDMYEQWLDEDKHRRSVALYADRFCTFLITLAFRCCYDDRNAN